jgi:hypothetical protein
MHKCRKKKKKREMEKQQQRKRKFRKADIVTYKLVRYFNWPSSEMCPENY